MSLSQSLATPPPAGRGDRPPMPLWVTRTDATHFEIGRDAVAQALLFGLAGDLSIHRVTGGWQLDEFPAEGLFGRLGLARWDVVRAINGVPLAGREALVAAYARSDKQIDVSLLRDGAPLTLSYRMR